jgi:hypothetical protein
MGTIQLRKQNVLASNLLFAGVVVSWVTMAIGQLAHVVDIQLTNLSVGKMVLSNALLLGLIYAIRVGEPWARFLLVLLVIVGTLSILLRHGAEVGQAPILFKIEYLLRGLLYLAALVLLFKKPKVSTLE